MYAANLNCHGMPVLDLEFSFSPFLELPTIIATQKTPPSFTSFQHNCTCSTKASPYSCFGIVKLGRLGRHDSIEAVKTFFTDSHISSGAIS